MTVRELKALIADLPDSTEVVVEHEKDSLKATKAAIDLDMTFVFDPTPNRSWVEGDIWFSDSFDPENAEGRKYKECIVFRQEG